MKDSAVAVGLRVVLALVIAAAVGCSREEGSGEAGDTRAAVSRKGKPAIKGSYDPHEAAKRAVAIRAALPVEEDESMEPLSDAEWAVRNEMQAALDDENLPRVLELVEKVRKTATHPAVRRDAVRVLGWFGAEVLDQLLVFSQDAEKGTAKDALELIATAIDGIDNEEKKSAAIVKAMTALKDDVTLDELATQIASLERPLELATILKVVECGNPKAVAKGKEAYKFLTDTPFVDRETAVKWICDNMLDGEDLSAVTNAPPLKK